MKAIHKYFERLNFSIWDIFRPISFNLKIQYLHNYFNNYSNSFGNSLREQLSFQELAKHLKDNLQKFSFSVKYVNMNKVTKTYFEYHIGKTISFYFLVENMQSHTIEKLKINPFLLAMLKGIFDLEVIITAKHPNEKILFQPFHSLKVKINQVDITEKIEKLNFFYSLGEDFGDGVTNEHYNKKTKSIDFSTIII